MKLLPLFELLLEHPLEFVLRFFVTHKNVEWVLIKSSVMEKGTSMPLIGGKHSLQKQISVVISV